MFSYAAKQRCAGALLLAACALLAAAAADAAKRRWFHVQTLHISGGNDMTRAAVGQAMRRVVGGNLFDAGLFEWKRRLENLPGVARAHLRRILPDTLTVRVETHKPLARWHGGGLIDVYGDRYDGGAGAALPMFKGPNGRAQNMMEFYDDAADILPADAIAQLELDAGGDWRVFLRDNLVLYLGRETPRRQLRLYTRHAAALRRRFPHMRAVDLRYERGFTVVQGGGEDEQ